jgi:hypothetical protein
MKPTWWLLYAIGVSLVGGLALVELTVPEEGLRVVLQSFVVVIGFAPRRLGRTRARGARKRERFRAAPDARTGWTSAAVMRRHGDVLRH